MPTKRPIHRWLLLCATALACSTAITALAAPAAPPRPPLQLAFAAAAREFAVPEPLLLAVAYNVSRWEHHGGAPSAAGGYGVMHLIEPSQARSFDGRGLGQRARLPDHAAAASQSLAAAAGLLGVSPELLRSDPGENIRGGAALLAQYARETVGRTPVGAGDWYGAVARYSGSAEAAVALFFADGVYATLNQGVSRTTSDGQQITLAAQRAVIANPVTARSLGLRRPAVAARPDCPEGLDCHFVPAAYQLNNAADLSDYGNYDFANRPADGLPVRYIVIHNTEANYNSVLQFFQSPSAYVSSHYMVRAADGQVAQFVRSKNVAWHAGNWYINGHSIGIEHEGVAIEGASWYSEQMYRASAALVASLARKYNIPLDRAHIFGHDEIPGPLPRQQAGMHWDPGPFWDWEHYMQLLGAPLRPAATAPGDVLTISPVFAANRPPLSYCYDAEADDCRAVPSQPANFVYLYSAPSFSAPLITNPYIATDPTRANNWANKVVTGQQFFRADRQGEWDAIYFGGQLAWLHNPGSANAFATSALLVTPKAGRESIPVYGRAYPEEAAYPTGTLTQTIAPIYELPKGQRYVATDLSAASYYSAPTYAPTLEAAPHRVITGETTYYRIFFNHRFAFVKASDVDVIVNRSVR